ncbi:Sialic acid TRAP transporter permease protein SiaT [Rosistilla ulvae]|uniref:Sialic acid TRAP transporter permease protein SiaT n=1 Tax=Rosistilla ulvae TaxID=1930277 RepID=A0A517M063_9BACT|nr:TRAP transporter fused permease subunit [Rosistilla ulvae]QDS88268.1 Sialic acid TRAP transporter permease protein SiaT [Rosistilla ulvae]
MTQEENLLDRTRRFAITALGVFLCLFTLFEVNYNLMQPQSSLAVFVGVGLALCYLTFPLNKRFANVRSMRLIDVVLAIAAAGCCGYVVVQTEPLFESLWSDGISLGNRAGAETSADFVVGLIGLALVLEATRRSIGLIVPLLALFFVAHSYYCYGSLRYDWVAMPDWMLPHAGQNVKDIVSTTFLQSLGVFGPAASVMFKYVFLFVVFGAFLEMSGATQFIIDFATKVFGKIRGGPAMVSVVASGLMGSLSGSAVANAVTTGTFTIPMMRSARFPNYIAGGITAAAASGGALVPPVMGAGAYMMLELVQPQVTFLTIMKAALLPAILYYVSILAVVFLYSRRLGAEGLDTQEVSKKKLSGFEAMVFFGALGTLIGLLIAGFSPFRSVTGALAVILVFATLRKELAISASARWMAFFSFFAVLLLHQATIFIHDSVPSGLQTFMASSWIHPTSGEFSPLLMVGSLLESAIVGMFGLLIFGLIHPAWRPEMTSAMTKSAKNGISLVAASACVGIIIGIVQQTGIATDFSSVIKGVVETNLFLALLGIMVCSLILGMGVPSVVCYLLMATLMGSLLGELGVIPLVAHLFIFYFGMMSMVTPPVALAGYASASIAEAPIMKTSFAAFRFSLVGFTLPFMFVYRPALCLLAPDGQSPTAFAIAHALTAATIGILALAGCIAGYFRNSLSVFERVLMFISAALLLAPITKIGEVRVGLTIDIVGAILFIAVVTINAMRRPTTTNGQLDNATA